MKRAFQALGFTPGGHLKTKHDEAGTARCYLDLTHHTYFSIFLPMWRRLYRFFMGKKDGGFLK